MFPSNIDTLIQEIREAKSVVNTVLVMVCSDFDRLYDDRKMPLVERISANGGIVKVMKGFSADTAKSSVRSFAKDLV
jgi:hypothetical protein